MGKLIKTKAKTTKKVEKSRRKGETRTSMFITTEVYDACVRASARVGLPMRQIWEAGILAVQGQEEEAIKDILTQNGITPGWRARK